MRYCSNCGAPLDEDALFCPDCGTKVELPPMLEQEQPPIPMREAGQSQPQIDCNENIQEVDNAIEVEGNDRKWTYICAGIAVVILVAVFGGWFYLHHKSSSNNILGLQQPKWEKFVHMTGKETAFYKSPDTSSPRLMQASNAEGCGVVCQNYWSDEKPHENMTDSGYYPYTDETSVFPVVEENEGWYKVCILDGEKQCEAYVEKTQCEEVIPEPITQDILSQIDASYNLQKGEKYDNICFKLDCNEGGDFLCVGELLNQKCLAFGWAYRISLLESDTTKTTSLQEDSYVKDDGNLEYSYMLYYGPSRSVSLNGYKNFDTQKITADEMEQFVSSMAKVKNDNFGVRYEYYFPTVSTSHLFSFNVEEIQVAETSESVDEKHVTEYKVEGKSLMALLGDEWIDTSFSTEGSFEIYQQQDLDEDGNVEIVLQDFEGNYIENPFVIYYDKATNSFKQTESMELEQSPSVETGESGGTLLVQREGLRTVKYLFTDGKLKIVSDKMQNVGTIRYTISVKDVYPNDGDEGERNMTFDFDGDGEDENVTFYRGTTHADGYGRYMKMLKVTWSDGREVGPGVAAGKFRFLASETNGMPDIIADNNLMKWNGSSYE